jgi:uncharacterized protein YfaS (alpha-2-macroglobulin family)
LTWPPLWQQYFRLQPDAPPGYRLESGGLSISQQRNVAEINLQVSFDKAQALAGESLEATVNARYFFDAPAGNVDVSWVLYEAPETFSIPGYQSGGMDEGWLQVYDYGQFYPGLGSPVASGSAVTGPDGKLTLAVPIPETSADLGRSARRYTLEVTAVDESGLPVSARGAVLVHPASFYIGVPDVWSGQAGQETERAVVDGRRTRLGSRCCMPLPQGSVCARWACRRFEVFFLDPHSEISSVDFATAADGKARLAFTPPQPGTYLLDVSGGGAFTQVMVWVGGSGQAVWPNLPNQRLRLTPDLESYQPGQTARVFVPNPFAHAAEALVTVDGGDAPRGRQPAGLAAALKSHLADDAPNVFV